jgi:hypothetical protein
MHMLMLCGAAGDCQHLCDTGVCDERVYYKTSRMVDAGYHGDELE